MELGSPIRITIFDGEDSSKKLSTVKIDGPTLSVKGSMINADKTDFKVNLDWKQQVLCNGPNFAHYLVELLRYTLIVLGVDYPETPKPQKNVF